MITHRVLGYGTAIEKTDKTERYFSDINFLVESRFPSTAMTLTGFAEQGSI